MYTTKIENGDEVRSVTNTGYELISDSEKIRQDVEMVLRTEQRRNGLGANISNLIGQSTENPAYIYNNTPFMFELQLKVRSALLRLKNAQRKYQFNQRTPKELIQSFSDVSISPITQDPRNYTWDVKVTTIDNRSSFALNGTTRS